MPSVRTCSTSPGLLNLYYGHLAHYCTTSDLARAMIALARSPQEKAFAYGWLAHVVQDSVAHPWVNGFTGGPFTLGLNGSKHIHIEAWVNLQVLPADLGERATLYDELLNALTKYITDPAIPDLIRRAYDQVYGQITDCKRKPLYEPLPTQTVVQSGQAAFRAVSKDFGGVARDLPSLPERDGQAKAQATYARYLGYSTDYTAAAWVSTGLPNLNMDQGIGEERNKDDGTRIALQNVYDAGEIFPTPGFAYQPGGAKPDDFQDKCPLKGSKDCGNPNPNSPGGDNPDDAVSVGSASTPEGSGRADFSGAVRRLATKRGEQWPSLVARDEKGAEELLRLFGGGDREAFHAALAQAQAQYAADLERDSKFEQLMKSDRPDPSFFNAYADIGVLQNGFAETSGHLVETWAEPVEEISPADFGKASQHPVLLVPTGGLYGLSNGQEFRVGLESYVRAGGVAIVFAQQHGADFSVLPTPDGQPIRGWGWVEDNSCYWDAAYIETFHPILASQSTALVASNVDGYFENIPANAIVLLKRVKNNQPVMFMYPYGRGWVIVSSSYDDWGGFNQSSLGARAIVRDTIAWAKKPADLPLHAPGSTAAVTLQVKNVTDSPASQVKLMLTSPSRDRVITEQTVGLAVTAPGTVEVPFTYAFPANAELGIYHVDYELLDDAGVTVQPETEEDTGRIVLAKPPSTNLFKPKDLTLSIIAPGGEDIVGGDPLNFRLRFVNGKDTPRRLRLYWGISWHVPKFLEELVVPANGSLEEVPSFPDDLPRGGAQRLFVHVFEDGGEPKDAPWYISATQRAESFIYQLTEAKGFRVHMPTAIMVAAPDRRVYTPGETAVLTVSLANQIPFGWDSAVRVTVSSEPGQPVVGEQTATFAPGGSWSGSFRVPIPSGTELRMGKLLRISVKRGVYQVAQQDVWLRTVEPEVRSAGLSVPAWSRIAGNPVRWTLENAGQVPVLNGLLNARLKDQAGGTLWEETRPFTLDAAPGGRASFDFVVPPIPTSLSHGTLIVTADNGFGRTISEQAVVQSFLFASVRANASDYGAGESAEVEVRLMNAGTFLEEGPVVVSIAGVGSPSPVDLSLPSAQQTTLRFPFVVLPSVTPGLHKGVVTLPRGSSVEFAVRIRGPQLDFAVDDRLYSAGESVPVTIRNTGGSRTTSGVSVTLEGVAKATETLTFDAGAEASLAVSLPAQLASGTYRLEASAIDTSYGRTGLFRQGIRVSGTSAQLTVATDREVYATDAPVETMAHVVNSGRALENGLLHLEVATPCIGFPPEEKSFYVETRDGASWVERAVRHRGALFETDVVDLSGYLPDPQGEYRVRIRHAGLSPAVLDSVALLSSGTLVSPAEGTLDGVDVLGALLVADDAGPEINERSVELRFPPVAAPALVFRAREGVPSCSKTTFWQRDVPLDLGPADIRDVSGTLAASWGTGQFVLSGAVRNRDGLLLSQSSQSFEVVSGSLAVSVGTTATLYRAGDEVLVSGTARNLSPAEEPSVTLVVYRREGFDRAVLFEQTLTLGAGESRDYSFTTAAVGSMGSETASIVAELLTGSGPVASSEWGFAVGRPAVSSTFSVPDPSLRLVGTSPRLVVAEEADLDAVTKDDAGAIGGNLPFPVTLAGTTYTAFRQSSDGFVELIPAGGLATGFAASCLELSGGATILAPVLSDLDPSVSGFVGYRLYRAGSADRAGRVFPADTLVFFWEAPLKGEATLNRFQLLLASDGLVRVDVEAFSATPFCAMTGISLAGEVFSLAPTAPFALRVENGALSGKTFTGSVSLVNSGRVPGTVSVDYGRAGGPRTSSTLTLGVGETRTLRFEDTATTLTTYTLTVTGDLEDSLRRTVTPSSETVAVSYVGSSSLVPGSTLLPVRLVKGGGVAGPVSITFTLSGPGGTQTLSRSYDLEPGIVTFDAILFEVLEGALTLRAEATVPISMEPVVIRAAPDKRMNFVVTAGSVSGGALPIAVDLGNSGLLDFTGEVEIEGVGGSRVPVRVPAGGSLHRDLSSTLAGVPAGPRTFIVRLVSDAGAVLAERTITSEVAAPRVVLVDSPDGGVFDAAAPATLHFRLRNAGDLAASGRFRFQVFDEDRVASFALGPGEETDLVFEIRVDDDVEQKVYRGRYVIEADGATEVAGQVNFSVRGIALSVVASLDREAYADGETAHLRVEITNGRPTLGTNYLVRVHYGAFEEVRPVIVSGTATATFDVPLPQVTGESVFLGISHPDGRSLYINSLHIRRADALATVALDQQVYLPGGTIALTTTTASAGTLTLSAPGYSETITVSGPVSRSFALPPNLPGGTYFVTWSFSGSAGSASGSTPFDVAGLRVRVFEASLDRGRYQTGDPIQTTLQINTNEATSATLRAFILDPEGLSQPVGETTVALTPETDLVTTHTWPFASTTAGLHRLAYGIYQPGSDTLLASGSLAFDVGNAALLGVRTDRAEYTAPDTPVVATVSAFVSGPASLRLEVDGQSASTPDVTGTGIVTLPATLSGIAPGPHELVAVMEGGGYTSRASTTFAIGTSLPDLVPGLATARPVSGASWKIDVTVSNVGRSDAPATQLAVRDVTTSAVLGTADVPALAAGASVVVSIDWNVLGRAGSREVEVVADATDSVREFREDNNRSVSVLQIPSLVMTAVAAPSYEANVEAGLGSSITNLTASTSYAGLLVAASIARPDGAVIPLAPAPVPPLGPGATVAVGTPWLVGRSLPGIYVLQSRLVDASAATLASSATAFEVVPTIALSGTVNANPRPAVAGQAVALNGHIVNEGNVAVSGTARFEVVAPDRTIAARATAPAAVSFGGSTDVTASITPLNVQPGSYDLVLSLEIQNRVYPVARSPLTVTGAGIEARIESDPTPRVLVYLGGSPHDATTVARRRAFVQASLAGTGVVLKATADPIEFALLFRSGLWNTFVLLADGPVLVPLLADELREAVFRGDGLVFVPGKGVGASELEPALGARVVGKLAEGEHRLSILDGPLGPAQALRVPGPASRLQISGATLAGTMDTGVPVLAVNAFGQGRDVTMGFDPAVPPGHAARAALQGLFAKAVLYAAPRQMRATAAGTVVPLAVSLNNPGSTAQPIEVTLDLPSGLRAAVVEDSPVSQAPPSWQVTLAAGVHRTLHFQVVVPNQAGTYTIESRIQVNGQAITDPPHSSLVVARTTGQSLTAVIADLEALSVAPRDRGHVQAAISLLRVAQGLPVGLLGLEGRIRLAAEAAEKLGQIRSVDVSGPRSDVDRLIAAWERASYELASAR